VVQTPINAKNRILSNNKYGSGSIGFKGSSNKNEATYGFRLREIQMVLAGLRVINASEKHNLFPYIDEDKIEYLRVSQEIYKEDYYFEIKCSESNKKILEEFTSYDCYVLINDLIGLLAGRMEFNFFELNLITENDLEDNIFRLKYEDGYLIKEAGLIAGDRIGFTFDKNKSPLISEFF